MPKDEPWHPTEELLSIRVKAPMKTEILDFADWAELGISAAVRRLIQSGLAYEKKKKQTLEEIIEEREP